MGIPWTGLALLFLDVFCEMIPWDRFAFGRWMGEGLVEREVLYLLKWKFDQIMRWIYYLSCVNTAVLGLL